MELFSKKIGPVFLKETGDTEIFIERMEKLQEKAVGEIKKEIEKQLKVARYGQLGERNIAFELKTVEWTCMFYMIYLWNKMNFLHKLIILS